MDIAHILLLEQENQQTQGPGRPGVVDLAYSKLIKEWTDGLSEQDRASLGVLRMLIEGEVNWGKAQAETIMDMVDHPVVRRWAKKKGLNEDEEVRSAVMDTVTPGFGAFRDWVNDLVEQTKSEGTTPFGKVTRPSGAVYDAEDEDAFRDGLKRQMLEYVRKDMAALRNSAPE